MPSETITTNQPGEALGNVEATGMSLGEALGEAMSKIIAKKNEEKPLFDSRDTARLVRFAENLHEKQFKKGELITLNPILDAHPWKLVNLGVPLIVIETECHLRGYRDPISDSGSRYAAMIYDIEAAYIDPRDGEIMTFLLDSRYFIPYQPEQAEQPEQAYSNYCALRGALGR